MEKELEKTELLKYNNIAFDKSGNFIAFAGLAGIKVVNIVTDKVVRVLGRPENLRFLQVLDLFQRSCLQVCTMLWDLMYPNVGHLSTGRPLTLFSTSR